MLRQAVAPAKCNGLCESDQKLAAMIGEFLSHEDKDISVCVKNGFVSLTINDHQKMLQHAAHPLSEWAQGFAGVKSVEVGVGKEYHQFNAYMKVRRKQSRTFLSDERESSLQMFPAGCAEMRI